jgi:hypothetical protein
MNPNTISSGLWAKVMCQDMLIWTILVPDNDNEGGQICMKARGMCNSLQLPYNFAVNLNYSSK